MRRRHMLASVASVRAAVAKRDRSAVSEVTGKLEAGSETWSVVTRDHSWRIDVSDRGALSLTQEDRT